MSIFFKHILRTVKKAPLQPLLILLTVIMSVAVGVTSFRFGRVFFVRAEEMGNEEVALGDITVTASSERSNGILFDSDAKDLLGDRARVLGDFSLVAFRDGEHGKKQPLLASGVDLSLADSFFLFDYYEYGEFNTENSDRAVIISKSFSDKSGLHVGDVIEVSVLNEKIEYKVEAVAENSGLLLKKDILLPIDSIIRLLSKRSAFISSLGNSFEPYNRLMIKCAEGEDPAEIADILSSSPLMSGCRIDNMADNTDGRSFALFESIATLLLAFLISGLAVLLIITSQSLMQKQRATEYALFCAAGASRSQIALLQYMESLIYAAVGALVGIMLSPYMLKYVISLFSWQSYEVFVGFEGIIFGIVMSFVLSFLGTFISVRRDKNRELALVLGEGNYPKATNEGYGALIGSGAFTAVCLVIALICGTRYRYIPMILALISFAVLLYVSSGHILKAFSAMLEKISERRKRSHGVALLAFKSLKNNHSLRHSGRLLCVLFALLCAIFICSGELTRQYDSFDNIIKGEMITVNMNSETAEKIKKDPIVSGVSTFYYSDAVMLNGQYEVMTIFTSGDSDKCLSEDFAPKTMPSNGEIVISRNVARLIGVRSGEYLTVEINGSEHKVKIVEISDIKIPMAYMDCSYVPTNMRMNCIKLNDGIEMGDSAYGEIIADISASGAQIIDEKEITGTIITMLGGFTSLIEITVVMAVVISLVGCANVFLDTVMSRKREREILCLCGMERARVILMHILEGVITLLFALAVGMLCGVIICLGLNVCLNSFGFALF